MEVAAACIRSGAIEDVLGLMDRHELHGGIQNVCLRLLCDRMKDTASARQAEKLGALSRVLKALETTTGREVQYNGCAALRLLADIGRAPRAGLQEVLMKAKGEYEGDIAMQKLTN